MFLTTMLTLGKGLHSGRNLGSSTSLSGDQRSPEPIKGRAKLRIGNFGELRVEILDLIRRE